MPTNVIVILLFLASVVVLILGYFDVPINHPAYVALGLFFIGLIVERASGTTRQP